jgi:hypothetical protein
VHSSDELGQANLIRIKRATTIEFSSSFFRLNSSYALFFMSLVPFTHGRVTNAEEFINLFLLFSYFLKPKCLKPDLLVCLWSQCYRLYFYHIVLLKIILLPQASG